MASEMIERVARAICAKTDIAMEGMTKPVFDKPDYIIPAAKRTDGKPLARWRLYEEQARAAIGAMREPTAEMTQAGFELTGDPCWQEDVGRAWRAMIDTALADPLPVHDHMTDDALGSTPVEE